MSFKTHILFQYKELHIFFELGPVKQKTRQNSLLSVNKLKMIATELELMILKGQLILK